MSWIASWKQLPMIGVTLVMMMMLQGCFAFAIPATLGAVAIASETNKRAQHEQAPDTSTETANMDEPPLEWRQCFQKTTSDVQTSATAIAYSGAAVGALITLMGSMAWDVSSENETFRNKSLLVTGALATTGVVLHSSNSHYDDSQFCRAVRAGKPFNANEKPAQ
jgi:hypothetical protein